MFNFIEELKIQAAQNPTGIAIELGRNKVTFLELWKNVQTVASNSIRLGYKPGDTFIFASKPTPRTISMALGLVHAGLCLAFIDPFTATHSFEVRAKLVSARLVIAESLLFTLGSKLLAGLRNIVGFSIADYGSIIGADFFFSGPWRPLMPRGSKRIEDEFFKPVDESFQSTRIIGSNSIIVFTSGTTADPKGVVHSLESISANFKETAEIFDLKSGDRMLCEPMTVGLVTVTAGATWVMPSERMPTNFNKFFGVPTDALKLLAKVDQDAIPKIEYFGVGGAPISPSLVRRVFDVVGEHAVVPCIYGMTEILPVAFCEGRHKLVQSEGDFLGKPLRGVDVRFAKDFELEIRGSGLMKNYLGKEPVAWHKTGDLAKLDSEGNLIMLSRKKNMLIRGDMNIYPSLYEPGLTTIKGVADAVIVGVPDEYEDDRIALMVVPSNPSQDRKALKALVEKEMPKYIDRDALPDLVIVLDQLPVSGRGKKRDMPKLIAIASSYFDESDR